MASALSIGLGCDLLLRFFYPGARIIELGLTSGLCLLACTLSILLFLAARYNARRQALEDSANEQRDFGRAGAGKIDPALPMIFHEIMNYASTMKGSTILLRRDMGKSDSKASLERLERATEQIQRIARGVLDVSMMGRPEEMKHVQLEALIKSCAESYFSNLGLTFSFTSDRVALPLKGDPRKLEQVFLNLFKNSMEAGATRISVALLAQKERIGVLIEDDGKGCSSEDIERMFEAYYSLRSAQGGSGLGMFLVKAIVEGHGGTIAGFSKTGKGEGAKGMMFVIQFPFS